MSTIFTSTVSSGLKETLNTVMTDKTDGYEAGLDMAKYMTQKTMTDNFEDDLEVGGPGLASEKPEGAEIALGSIREGYTTRYLARTFANRLIVTEEALEDCKYEQIINAARRLKRAMYKTVDVDAANVLVRMFNTSYVGGDGLCLANSAHTLPGGGTFSNVMATPLSPSKAAVVIATSQIKKMPGYDGITEGYNPTKVVHPVEQWAVWEELINSKFTPESNNFAEVNVVNMTLKLTSVPVKYWTNTTTNYAFLTDAEGGLQWRWRRKPRAATWTDNAQMLMNYSQSARWARGWSNPRAVLGVQA